jgi:hypothetical protein
MKNPWSKALGLGVIVLGLFVALAPKWLLPVCESEHLGIVNAFQPTMRCFWMGQTEILLGICIIMAGLIPILRPGPDALFAVGLMLAVLGIAVIMASLNSIIGSICGHQHSSCQIGTKPALRLAGALLIIIGMVSFALSLRKPRPS